MRSPRLRTLALAPVVTALALMTEAAPPAPRTIAVTFDDLPFVRLRGPVEYAVRDTGRILAALGARGVPAAGFVNEARLEDDGRSATMTAILSIWLDAGHVLGNHGYAHLGLNKTPADAYFADARRGAIAISRLARERGRRVDLFRPPFGETGATPELRGAFDAFLAKEGWRLAPFTADVRDFIYNRVWVDAVDAGDLERAARIRAAYLAQFDASLAFFEGLSSQVFGREVPQVLLLHANEIAADALGEALDGLEKRGYRFVPLDAALADRAYATPERWMSAAGPSWLHRWAHARGLSSREAEEPRPPKWVLELYEESVRRHTLLEAGATIPAYSNPAGR
jgi:peptidoglycan/xylan/chitin deacetylase (PgdA/CDA1 family)